MRSRLKTRFAITTAKLHRYETIPLKLYMEIAAEGDLKKLVIHGFASLDQCVEQWEQIIKKNSQESGSFEYDSYYQLLQGYWLLVAEHTIVKAHLLKLTTVVDWEAIQEVRARGYHISVDAGYTESLNNALRKVENLVTKARMREQEIARMFAGPVPGKRATFDEVMASLIAGMGFEISDKITLARFNQFRKILHERNKRAKEQRHGSRV